MRIKAEIAIIRDRFLFPFVTCKCNVIFYDVLKFFVRNEASKIMNSTR